MRYGRIALVFVISGIVGCDAGGTSNTGPMEGTSIREFAMPDSSMGDNGLIGRSGEKKTSTSGIISEVVESLFGGAVKKSDPSLPGFTRDKWYLESGR